MDRISSHRTGMTAVLDEGEFYMEKKKWPRTECWAELGVFQEGRGQLCKCC